MNEITELISSMSDKRPPSYESMPDIELYMDQVLSYLSRWQLSLRDTDKLTSAMVNNYIKDGLLPRAAGKKYSRDHLVYLSVISRLKQVLSVKDMGVLLTSEMHGEDASVYLDEFNKILDSDIGYLTKQYADTPELDVETAALQLAVHSYVCKIACEYLLDKMSAQKDEPDKAQKSAAKKPKSVK